MDPPLSNSVGDCSAANRAHSDSELWLKTAPLLGPALSMWLGTMAADTLLQASEPHSANPKSWASSMVTASIITASMTTAILIGAFWHRLVARLLLVIVIPFLMGVWISPVPWQEASLPDAPIMLQGEILSPPRFTWTRLSESAAPPLRATLGHLTSAGGEITGQVRVQWPSGALLSGRGARVQVTLSAGAGSLRKVATAGDIVQTCKPGLLGLFDLLRLKTSQRLQPICHGWASALVLGERRLIPPQVVADYRDTGLAHLLAISGLHVGMILGMLQWLGRQLPISWQRVWRPLTLLLLMGQALISGADAPAVRATVTGIFVAWGFNSGRVLGAAQIASLFLIAWCISGRPPPDPGASISLAAIAALQLHQFQRKQLLEFGVDLPAKHNFPSWIFGGYIAFLGAHAALVWWVPTICPAGPIFTLLLLPLVMATILLTGATLLLQNCLPAPFFEWAWDSLRYGLTAIPELLNHLPGTPLILPALGPVFWSLCFVVIVLTLLGRLRALALLGSFSLLSVWIPVSIGPPPLQVELLSRGQGQALLIRSADTSLLFDAGDTASWDGGYSRIRDLLWHRGIHRIDAMFLSHPHLDHQGAVPKLLLHRHVDSLFITETYDCKLAGQRIVQRAHRSGIPIRRLQTGQIWKLGEFRIFVLSTGIPMVMKPTANDLSPIILVEWRDQTILTTGDATAPILAGVPVSGPVDHVLLPHHGAPTVGLKEWLLRLQPKHVWVARRSPIPRETRKQLEGWPQIQFHFHGDRWVYGSTDEYPQEWDLPWKVYLLPPPPRRMRVGDGASPHSEP